MMERGKEVLKRRRVGVGPEVGDWRRWMRVARKRWRVREYMLVERLWLWFWSGRKC